MTDPRPAPPVPPAAAAAQATRTPEQIRASIEANRAELGAAVSRLRTTELADWRGHLRRHRKEVLVGAAVAGFVLGGGIAAVAGRFRRRR
jgi:hypothetical protein